MADSRFENAWRVSCPRRWDTVVIAVVWSAVLGVAGPAHAQTVSINFESYPVPLPVVDGQTVTNQYSIQGVSFSGSPAPLMSTASPLEGSVGHSLAIAPNTTLTFSPPVSRVSLRVGGVANYLRLTARNAALTDVDSDYREDETAPLIDEVNGNVYEVIGLSITSVLIEQENADVNVADDLSFDQESVGVPDADMDGTPDATDECDMDPLKSVAGVCGCGVPESALDADEDMVVDCNDVCQGDNMSGDTDMDGVCNDRDDIATITTEEFTDVRGPCLLAGGLEIRVGFDRDGDGELTTPDEITGTSYACAATGVRFLTEEIDEEDERCRAGGVEIKIGVDDNGNGELDEYDDPIPPLTSDAPVSEVDFTEELCNGLTTLVNTVLIDNQEICAAGGYYIQSGLDEDGDGELSDNEWTETKICNGLNGVISVTPLVPEPGGECPGGGIEIGVGTDIDGNGELSQGDEQKFIRSVCHGLDALVDIKPLDPDPEVCPNGGARIDGGVDKDDDGLLGAMEISSGENICYGRESLLKTTSLEKDPDVCAAGGTRVEAGLDVNGNGMLDPDEITSARNVCAGTSSLTRSSMLAPKAEQCELGGVKLESGQDDDADGTLDDDEVDMTQFICSGSLLAVRTTGLELGSEECPAGGTQFETGLDLDGDGELDGSEIQTSDSFCREPALLFEVETVPTDDEDCPHGGLRVVSGHDDGESSGVAGDGDLQSGEIELDRNVCLAPTEVLVSGGSGSCSATPGTRSAAGLWSVLLGALAVVVRRRRRSAVAR